MTPEKARELLLGNPLYFGNMLVLEGMAAGMVAGAAHATADVLRASLQVISTAPDAKLVSSFFVMVVPDTSFGAEGVFVFADCGLMQNPTAEELAEISISAGQSFESLVGETAKVALLSHSTMGSSNHPDADKVVAAVRLAKEKAPNLSVDGEMQVDAAIIPAVGQKKAPNSPVAGLANVLIFPDLDAGNIGYKLVERLAKGAAFGPLTQVT